MGVLTSLLDGRLFAERTHGRPLRVLALHGWGRGRFDLSPALSDVEGLLPDLPGFGLSPAPPVPWGSADYADLLSPLLDEGDARWIVLGHSFGGRVAVQLAAARPDRVSGLVLTGVPLLRSAVPSRSPLAFRTARALHRRHLLPDSALERARRKYGSQDYLAAEGVMRATLVRLVGEDYADLLPTLAMPVELVWGALDTAAPLEMVERAVPLIPQARLSICEASGHALDGSLFAMIRDRIEHLAPYTAPAGS
ncbi:MAG: hypothetical protein JWL64_1379 [Frankiales bacterium]|nr:hypothetical protein [Frankiales bacterium]